MKKRLFLIVLGCSISFTLNAQVKLLSLNELQSRMAKGCDTTYVINFWATWCAPCVKEIPYFEQLQQANANRPIKVILLSLDFKSKLNSIVMPFVAKHNIKTEVCLINEQDQQRFIEKVSRKWSGALPATWIVNKGKNVSTFLEKQMTLNELIRLTK